MSEVVESKDLIQTLIDNSVHFGHQTWRWNPRMAPFIWGKRNGVHLIDVSKTAFQMQRVAEILEKVAAEGKQVLFVGTKPAARATIERIGRELQMPVAINRWIGGTLTNYSQVRKSVARLMHFEDVIAKADKSGYTKKEMGVIQKSVDRLVKNVGGIRALRWPVGAIIVVDIKREQSAVREAREAGVPVIGLVDTNCDPTMVDYVIPANDDVARSIKAVLDYLAEAVKKGSAQVKKEAVKTEAPAEQMITQLLEQALGGSEEEASRARKAKTAQAQTRRPMGRPGDRRPAPRGRGPKPE